MALSAITIENFKSISGPERIEFKPITLLFGPNSAGKSSVVHALHYLAEVLGKHNANPDRTTAGGDTLDLGGFKNLLYRHDLNSKMRFRVELALDESDVSDFVYYAPGIESETEESEWIHDFYWEMAKQNKKPWFELTIRWSSFLDHPVVDSFKTGFDDELFAEISSLSDGKQIALTYLHLDNPVFTWKGDHNRARQFLDNSIIKDQSGKPVQENILQLNVDFQVDTLPKWPKLFFPAFAYTEDIKHDEYSISYDSFDTASSFDGLLNSLLLSPVVYMKNYLQQFRYIGPLRKIPDRKFQPALGSPAGRWADGLAAWDTLFKSNGDLLNKVNTWLSDPKLLNTIYNVEVKRYRELDIDHSITLDILQGKLLDSDANFKKLLLDIPEKSRLVILDTINNMEVAAQDIGVGISQVLPIIVLSLSSWGGLLAIEQPELHIHPALQVAIGDLFISQSSGAADELSVTDNKSSHRTGRRDLDDLYRNPANINGNKLFVIETHSEHLLLRLLRRVRETMAGDQDNKYLQLRPEQLAVYYLQNESDGCKVHHLSVDENGDFTEEWPAGFFDEREEELFG
ncbi:MAG: putative ATPase [Desulforhopalus sp.]|jgi:predicted ATPase